MEANDTPLPINLGKEKEVTGPIFDPTQFKFDEPIAQLQATYSPSLIELASIAAMQALISNGSRLGPEAAARFAYDHAEALCNEIYSHI